MALHALGHERDAPFAGLADEAAYYRQLGQEAGLL
jgi:hypothetical protein